MSGLGSKSDNRNSSFELLRFLCIFGILLMHIIGPVYGEVTGGNRIIAIVINSLFNAGVSIFILISGYWGIRQNPSKLWKLGVMVEFYSILDMFVYVILNRTITKAMLIQGLFPIITKKYWFITCYFVIAIFSRYLNRIVEILNRKDFEKLLIGLLVAFSFLPTVFYYEITSDTGKGLINLCVIYLIGQYLRKYQNETTGVRFKIVAMLLSFGVTFGGNLLLSLRNEKGIFAPFARDNSITIIALAISIFLIFKNVKLQSRQVNWLASHVLPIYLMDRIIRNIFTVVCPITNWGNRSSLFLIVLLEALTIVLAGVLVNSFRILVLGKLEQKISDKLAQRWGWHV